MSTSDVVGELDVTFLFTDMQGPPPPGTATPDALDEQDDVATDDHPAALQFLGSHVALADVLDIASGRRSIPVVPI
jgi:hypothetical protein